MRQQRYRVRTIAATVVAGLLSTHVAFGQDYRLERLLTGVQQPTYITQAPGDNNSLYWVERTKVVGTNATAAMGRVVKYDLNTQTATTFVDFSGIGGSVPNDSGALCLAFHPDFATNGKFYTTYAASPAPVTNALREYKVVGGIPQFQRTILQYNNTQGSFHTIDWIGFKHNQTGEARDHLYITTGDGGPQSNNSTYVNKAQNLNEIYGKLLRVDVRDDPGGTLDAYPADPNKHFVIPTINSYPGAPAKLGEVITSGLRNPFRASFDRANNDMYIGDVGFNDQEEVDFIKHESINPLSSTLGVQDFGWPKREGIKIQEDAYGYVSESNPGLIAGPKGSSLDPFIYRTPATGDNSVTGGYVYRGPIASLAGKYIFADYVAGKVYTLNFDRTTDPTTFNGTNYTNFQDVTSAWEASIAGGFDLRRISSFGEDNAGNLYLVSLGDDSGSPYTSINEGQIFKLVPVPVWNTSGGGDYFTAGNWTSLVPGELSGVGKEVRFLGAIASTSTVTANAPVTLGTLRFNDNNTYILGGSGSLTMQTSSGVALIDVTSNGGTHEISLPVVVASDTMINLGLNAALKFSGAVTVNSGVDLNHVGTSNVLYQSDVTLQSGASILLRAPQNMGAFTLAASAIATVEAGSNNLLHAQTLNMNASATLNLHDNDLVVESSPFSTVQALVLAGFGTTSPGITSGTSNGTQILALFDNTLVGSTDWQGTPIGASAIVGKYTYFGDVNLDGQVTGDDYAVVDSNLDTDPPVGLEWLSGDANLDGIVTGDDYATIDSNLGLGVGNPLGPAAVPEPIGAALLLIGSPLLAQRRRRMWSRAG